MKSYRYLLLSVLASMSTIINAQTDGTIQADFSLNQGESGVEVINQRYGIAGSQITAQITVNGPTLLDGQKLINFSYQRVIIHNNDSTTEIPNIQDGSDEFEPEVGLNQILNYKVEFTISRDGKEDTTIVRVSDEFVFSIYDKTGYTFTFIQEPEGPERNTYAGRKDNKIDYSVEFKDQDKTLPAHRISWERNEDSLDCFDETYSFDPSELTDNIKKEYTFSATISFLRPDNNEVWFSSEPIKSNTIIVYASRPNGINLTNEDIIGNTIYSGKACTYSVDIKEDDYGNFRYEWYFDSEKQSDSESNQHTYTPNVTQKGDHTIRVKCFCSNPGNEKEDWYDVEGEMTLTVYLNPNDIKEKILNDYLSISQPNEKGRVNTYVNRGDQVYKIEIPDSASFGRWVYTWNRTRNIEENVLNDSHSSDASFNPSARGTYHTTLSINCENPNSDPNDPETWLEINASEFDSKIPDLVVYGNPHDLTNIDFIYPKDDQVVALETDCSRQYSVNLPEEAAEYGKWVCMWTRERDGVPIQIDNNDNNAKADIPENIGKGTYVTTLKLTCSDPDTDEPWLEYENVPSFPPFTVYPETTKSIKNLHKDQTDTTQVYTMYVGQDFDASKLFQLGGGCEWEDPVLSIKKQTDEDYVPQFNLIFSPDNPAKYALKLTMVNNAPLPNGTKKKLDEYSAEFNFEVLDNPYQQMTVQIDDNGTSKVVDERNEETDEIEIHIEQGNKISFNNNSEVKWSLEDSNESVIANNDDNKSFEWIGINNSSSKYEPSVYTLTSRVANDPEHIIEEYQDQTLKIMVWQQIDFEIESLKYVDANDDSDPSYKNYYVMETCEGLKEKGEDVRLKFIGGAANKWTDLNWYLESAPGTSISSKTEHTFTDLKAKSDGSANVYLYNVKCNYNTKPIEKKVAIIVWPKPSLENVTARLRENQRNPDTSDITYVINENKQIVGECYVDDVIQVDCDLSGGISDYTHGWIYNFRNDNKEKPIEDSLISYSFADPGNNKSSSEFQILYKYPGKYWTSEKIWYQSDNYRFNFDVYALPISTPNLTDSVKNQIIWGQNRVDVCESNAVELSYISSNGKSDGWTCTWIVDGDSIISNETAFTYNPIVTTNAPSQEKDIVVNVVNKLENGNVGFKQRFIYPIRVWRKPEIAKTFILSDENNILRDASGSFIYDNDGIIRKGRIMSNNILAIREGNIIHGSVTPMKYGYGYSDSTPNPNSYSYIWSEAFNGEGNGKPESYGIVALIDNNNKDVLSCAYKLEMVNMGPYGKPWGKEVITYSDVQVYNKPLTPTSIEQKGRGASGTMIITANVSDTDLEGRQYYLVFGYTDNDGVDHDFASLEQKKSGLVRWSSQFKNEIPNDDQRAYAMKHAYVYALWKYGNVEITSGKRLLGGVVDEDYDSSTYDGTTRAAIGGDETDAIDIINNPVEVRNVYTANGVHVGTTLKGLKAGLYIVEFADGVINKVSVK